MNVFITGISGFVGKKLAEFIASDKDFDKIYCLCRSNIDLPQNFTIINGSLSDLDELPATDADVCIHLAAVTNSVTQNDEVYKTNESGTGSVINFCKKSGISKIVFLSSINVYLSQKYEYAMSKLAAERLITESGIRYSILRCSLIYGEGCPSFEKIIKSINTFHTVPVLGKGTAYEQPIYIDEACRYIIKHAKITEKNEIVDLFGKTKMSYNDMIIQIAIAVNKNTRIIHLPLTPVKIVAEFCAGHNIPFPVQPEQIFHMIEDLCCENEKQVTTEDIELDDFADNLKKYLP